MQEYRPLFPRKVLTDSYSIQYRALSTRVQGTTWPILLIQMLAPVSLLGVGSLAPRGALFKEPRVNVAQVQSGHRNAGRRDRE